MKTNPNPPTFMEWMLLIPALLTICLCGYMAANLAKIHKERVAMERNWQFDEAGK